MKEVNAVSRGYRRMVFATAFVLLGFVSACGGNSNVAQSAPGLSCVNYALHGSGKFHNELSVQVKIHNSTTRPARYVVEVDLITGNDTESHSQVMILGSVASRTSAELARKVLTTNKVQQCRIAKVSRTGLS
jgi:hypothetical protein